MLGHVSWPPYATSVHYRGDKPDRPAGEGKLLGFLLDHDGQPSGVVVGADGRFYTIRLQELRWTHA